MPIPVGGISPFSIGPLVGSGGAPGASGAGAKGFGQALANSLGQLDATQAQASQQAQALATGQATDASSVVMAVEKASLEVQLATQIRTKATDAFNEIMRMQV
jgi:flagellar hook-basal body complex protein FliE